jgi:hypothetical protein
LTCGDAPACSRANAIYVKAPLLPFESRYYRYRADAQTTVAMHFELHIGIMRHRYTVQQQQQQQQTRSMFTV